MDKHKLLVVEDDPDLLLALTIRLRSNGYEVVTAQDAVQAAMQSRKEQPDLLILDISLPAGDGIPCLQAFGRIPLLLRRVRDGGWHKPGGLARRECASQYSDGHKFSVVSATGQLPAHTGQTVVQRQRQRYLRQLRNDRWRSWADRPEG